MRIIQKLMLVFAFSITYMVSAQESGIVFHDQPSWEEILKMAKKQNKPIFVDAYTTWCGPCKIMEKEVFTEKNVADYFNHEFINVKMDMEKGEGDALKTKWEVTAFPTLLYFNPNGEIIHRVVGAYDAKQFLVYSKMALDEDKVAANLQKRYDAGERDGAFIYDYLLSLRLGYYAEKEKEVSNEYISSLSEDDLLSKENWPIIKDFVKDPTTKEFQYLLSNSRKLSSINDEKEVNAYLYNTINKQIQNWSYWYGGTPFETEKESSLITFLQDVNYSRSPELLAKLLINKYKRIDDKVQYLEAVDYAIKYNVLSDPYRIVSYANNVQKTYQSESAFAKALTWLEIADRRETRAQQRAVILETKSEILNKLGNKTEAELAALAAKKADKQAEEDGTKIHYMPAMKMTGGGMQPAKKNN